MLSRVRELLSVTSHLPFVKREAALIALGMHPRSLRVTWSGGLGSCKLMRSGALRVVVGPNRTPYRNGHIVGFSYAMCVEI